MKQILILEDNELTRNKLIRIIKLMEKRVNVHAFSNEEEALGFAMIHKIDLFLVDIILHPEKRNDFSGITFAERIHECPFCGASDIVFITSLAGLEVDLLHRVHCYDYIEKPIDEERVKHLIDEILSRGEKSSKLPERMYFRNDGINYSMDVAEIRYVVHQNRILYIYNGIKGIECLPPYTPNGKECIEVPNLPLKQFMKRVRDSIFLSPLKGTAVNIAYIESVDYVNQYIQLNGIKERVSMGSVMKKKFRKQYESYVKRGY